MKTYHFTGRRRLSKIQAVDFTITAPAYVDFHTVNNLAQQKASHDNTLEWQTLDEEGDFVEHTSVTSHGDRTEEHSE